MKHLSHDQTLDYTPLHEPVTQADIANYKTYQKELGVKEPRRLGRKSAIAIVGILLLSTAVGIIFDTFTLGALMPGIIGGFIVWVVYLLGRQRQNKLAKLYKFSVRNGLTLLADVANPRLTGMIFSEGHSRMIPEAFMLNDGIEVGNYMYVTGSGKNRTTHTWGYAKIQLSRNLPHMVLDSKKNNFLKSISNLPVGFGGNRQLQLEGDFNNFFSVHVPNGYEQDALYVFTPDVMQVLIDSGAAYDMEIIDNTLLLYRQMYFDLTSEAQLKSILTTISAVAGEMRDQTKRYSDERVQTGSMGVNVVAPEGARLKNRLSVGSVVMLVIVVVTIVFTIIT